MLLTRSQLRIIIISFIVAPLFLLIAFPSHKNHDSSASRSVWSWFFPSGDRSLAGSSSNSKGDGRPHLTKIIAHAPGFTIVENVYWRNYTYYFLTDAPWHIPELKYVVSTNHIKEYGTKYRGMVPDEVVKILSVRGPALDSHMDESKELGTSTLPEVAKAFSDDAVEMAGTHFFLNDFEFIGHYYHFMGEMFLGAWRIVQHYYYQTGKRLPPFTHMNFLRNYNEQDYPDLVDPQWMWQDHAGANEFFLKALFPGIKVQARKHWEALAATGEVFRFPVAVIGDRYSGHNGPSASWKPWGDVLRLPVYPEWLTELRDRIVKIKRHRKPHVLYLSRQDTTRRLADSDHQALVLQLKKLEEEGLVKLTITMFDDGVDFVDQISLIGTVDFFVSVHGNGLTHTLWMNSGKHRAVFEMQPKGCTVTDYSPLATAAGVQHFLVNEDKYCTPETCGMRGCEEGVSVSQPNIKVRASIITDKIRNFVAQYKYD